jgi:hypothetical protein
LRVILALLLENPEVLKLSALKLRTQSQEVDGAGSLVKELVTIFAKPDETCGCPLKEK